MDKEIYQSRRQDFTIPNFMGKGSSVLNYFERVQSFLAGRNDFPNKCFLARPKLSKDTISWFSPVFEDDGFSALAKLPEVNKAYYLDRLQTCLDAWDRMVKTLEQGNENDKTFALLLKQLVSFVDERYVMCGKSEVVLVNWGIYPNEYHQSSVIYQDGVFTRDWNSVKGGKTGPKAKDSEPEVPKDTPEPPKSDPERPEKPEEPMSEPEGPKNPEPPTEPEAPKDEPVSPEPPQEPESPEEPEPPKESEKPEEPSILSGGEEPKITEKKSWFERVGKKLLSLLLLLLLVAGLIWLLKDCKGDLPGPDENVITIDTTQIILDEDSVSYILSNQLVILLENSDKKTVKAFAKAFKKLYPEENVRISFYDDKTGVIRLEVPKERRLEIKENLNRQMPEFSFLIINDGIHRMDATFNDPALENTGYSWPFRAIDAYSAWDITTGDEDVVIAIADNGFDLNHPELVGKIVNPYNACLNSRDIFPVNDVHRDHGTHVAATAAGVCNNGKGSLGIAPKCKIMPVQLANAFGFLSDASIFQGVMYAINNGADVINLSFGKYFNEDVLMSPLSVQMNMALNYFKEEEMSWNWITQMAMARNCVLVNAAGNQNILAGLDPQKRNRHTIQVSAIDSTFRKADFSNFGWWQEFQYLYSTVSAPGVAIYNAAPDGRFVSMNGTSMAAPIVTGAVALLKSVDKSLTPDDIIYILQSTGKSTPDPIGNVIQLGPALRAVAGETEPPAPKIDCDSIARRAQELMEELKRLKELCPDLRLEEDTLKYDDVVDNPLSMNGLWKSTSSLYSSTTGEKIELYFNIHYPKGELQVVEETGKTYKAPLTLSNAGGEINITQLDDARCEVADDSYSKYIYSCKPDRKNNLECTALLQRDGISKVVFNLIRIK